MEPTDRFYKFDLFKKLIEEITNLITEMQRQLVSILNQAPSENPAKRKPNKLGLFQRLKSLWPFNKFVKENSLHNYLLFNKEIENICEEIIVENFGLILESKEDQISQILIKFNNDFKSIVKKYADILQKDYDKEKEEYLKSSGVPDETPAEEIRVATEVATSMKDEVRKGIAKVLQNKSKSYSFSDNWFNNGEIKFEYFGEVLDYLLNEDIDTKDEEQIRKSLGPNYKPQSSFYSKLLKIYGNEEEIEKLKVKVLRKNMIIGSPKEIMEMFDKLQKENPDQAKQAVDFIKKIEEDPKTKRDFILSALEFHEFFEDEIMAFNLSINDDLRKNFLEIIRSSRSS